MKVDNETGSVALNLLQANGDDLRSTPAMEDADRELRASIAAHGLLEPLVVRRHDAAWCVVAGHRRYRALRALAAGGEIAADAAVNCTILHGDVDSTEAALAENVVRVAMHPADQVTAFKRLADEGASAEDIAGRFGLAKVTVEKRLRLGNLAPDIMAEYRAGNMNQEAAQAYASTADPEAQRRVFKAVMDDYGHHRAHAILAKLQENAMRSDSALAKFVGDDYHAAGGAAEITLFTDYSRWTDVELAVRLAREKLEKITARLCEAGWKWSELWDGEHWNIHQSYRQTHPQRHRRAPTGEEQTILDKAEALSTRWEAEGLDYDELQPDEQREWDEASARADAVAEALEQRTFTPEQMAGSGVLVYLGHDGEPVLKEGMVRKGDPMPGEAPATTSGTATSGTTAAGAAGAAHTGEQALAKPRGYSQKLQDNIMGLRNAVLRDVLREHPAVAQDALNFSLVLALFTGHSHGFYPDLPIAMRREHNPRLPVEGASDELKQYIEDREWQPPFLSRAQSIGDMFEAYRTLPADAKDAVIAEVCCRLLLDKPGGADASYDMHAAIAQETAAAWAPRLLAVDENVFSVATFWGKLRKDQIIAECRPYLGDEWAQGAEQLKKDQLAADAAKRMRAHPGWLPKGFHVVHPETANPESA